MSEKTSLLNSLRKYPIGKVDPKENFVTEAFAYILKVIPLASEAVLSMIVDDMDKFEFDGERWQTQVSPNGEAFFFDMQYHSENILIIIENKIESGFGDMQLKKYFKYLNKHSACKASYLVTITPYTVSKSTHKDVDFTSLTWRQIYYRLEEVLIKKDESALSEVDIFLLKEFLKLLEDLGMGPLNEIKEETVRAYYLQESLKGDLMALMTELVNRNELGLDVIISLLFGNANSSIIKPKVKYHWGRLGIDFCKNKERPELLWPSISFSTILDNSDHAYYPLDKSQGPDFCFILDILQKEHWNAFLNKDNHRHLYTNLVSEWNEIASEFGWDCLDNTSNRPFCAWHPLFIRKPISKLFKEKMTFEKQLKTLTHDVLGMFHKLVGANTAFQILRKAALENSKKL